MKKMVILILSVTLAACSVINKIRGKNDEVAPLKPNPVPTFTATASVERSWSFDIGGDRQAGLRAAVDGDSVFLANPNGRVVALGLDKGKMRWSTKLDISISGGVGTGEGLVMVGGLNGDVVALDRRDGSQVWRAKVSSEVMAPPEAAGGIAVVRTIDGAVTGLSTGLGESEWTVRHEVPSLTLRGSGPPLLYQGVAVMGFADGKLGAVRMSDGAMLWQVPVSRPTGTNEVERMIDVDAMPVLSGNELFAVAYHGSVTAYSLGVNQVMWSKEMSSHTDFAVDQDNLYISDSGGRVHALDRKTGADVWVQERMLRRRLSGAAVMGSYVLVGDYEGYLYVLNKSDGTLAGRSHFGSQIAQQPLVLGDRALVLTEDGRLNDISITGG